MTLNRIVVSVAALCVALIAAACSATADLSIGGVSPEQAAETLIEGELSGIAGLGQLTASCDEVADPAVGSEFNCTGTASDGQVVQFLAVIDREDHVDVNSTNLILAGKLPEFEAAGAQALGQQFGVEFPPGTIDCGDAPIVFAGPLEFVCTLFDPNSTDVWDAIFVLPDLDSGDFSVALGDAPRG